MSINKFNIIITARIKKIDFLISQVKINQLQEKSSKKIIELNFVSLKIIGLKKLSIFILLETELN